MAKFVEQSGAYLRHPRNCTSGPTVFSLSLFLFTYESDGRLLLNMSQWLAATGHQSRGQKAVAGGRGAKVEQMLR